MNDNKGILKKTPVEKHTTAAWANIEKTKDLSNVAIPNEIEVLNAKQWVDKNEKQVNLLSSYMILCELAYLYLKYKRAGRQKPARLQLFNTAFQ